MRNRKRLIVLLFLLLNISCVSLVKPSEITYLIPEGFTGGVIVVFNQPDGITPETTKDGNIIFQVPKDGLIKVKQPFDRSVYKNKYYFVDGQGRRTSIEYLYPGHYVRNPGDTTSKSFDTISEDETNNKTFAMIHTTSNFNNRGEKVYSENFMVGKPKDYQILYLEASDKVFDIQRELMKKEKTEKQ